jgi:hypothetical protein
MLVPNTYTTLRLHCWLELMGGSWYGKVEKYHKVIIRSVR